MIAFFYTLQQRHITHTAVLLIKTVQEQNKGIG